MDAKRFLEEWQRMCKAHLECSSCPAHWDRQENLCIGAKVVSTWDVDDLAHKVEQWAKEHPAKTRLDDLKEKHPDTPMINGYPPFAPRLVGYCGNIQTCAGCKQKHDSMHKQCWDMEVKG